MVYGSLFFQHTIYEPDLTNDQAFLKNFRMVILHVKVKPGSFKDEISIEGDGSLLIKIKEHPIDGAANKYLIKFLSKEFQLRKNDIKLEKGGNSRFKKISVDADAVSMEKKISRYKK